MANNTRTTLASFFEVTSTAFDTATSTLDTAAVAITNINERVKAWAEIDSVNRELTYDRRLRISVSESMADLAETEDKLEKKLANNPSLNAIYQRNMAEVEEKIKEHLSSRKA